MHHVLLGMLRSFLIIVKALYLALKTREKICEDLQGVRVPSIDGQKPRLLNHLKQWKASDFKLFSLWPSYVLWEDEGRTVLPFSSVLFGN